MSPLNQLSLENLAYTNKATVLEAQKLLDTIIKDNSDNFVIAVRENNLEKMAHNYAWGLHWDQKVKGLALKLSTAIEYNDLKTETLNFLQNIIPDEQPQCYEGRYNFPLKKENTPKQNWDLFFMQAVNYSVFSYGDFKCNTSLWLIHNSPESFNKESYYVSSFISRFCTVDLSNSIYQPIHDFLFKNYSEQLSKIFNNNMSAQNFDFLKNDSRYSKFYEQFYEKINSQEHKDKMMLKGFKDANLQLIKYWHENGIGFPANKEPYSYLFASKKTENLLAIEYVCKHIPDITLQKQTILKTVLHYNLIEVLPMVLERYNIEQLEQLSFAISNRENNECVTIAKKYMDYHLMQNKISHKSYETNKLKL